MSVDIDFEVIMEGCPKLVRQMWDPGLADRIEWFAELILRWLQRQGLYLDATDADVARVVMANNPENRANLNLEDIFNRRDSEDTFDGPGGAQESRPSSIGDAQNRVADSNDDESEGEGGEYLRGPNEDLDGSEIPQQLQRLVFDLGAALNRMGTKSADVKKGLAQLRDGLMFYGVIPPDYDMARLIRFIDFIAVEILQQRWGTVAMQPMRTAANIVDPAELELPADRGETADVAPPVTDEAEDGTPDFPAGMMNMVIEAADGFDAALADARNGQLTPATLQAIVDQVNREQGAQITPANVQAVIDAELESEAQPPAQAPAENAAPTLPTDLFLREFQPLIGAVFEQDERTLASLAAALLAEMELHEAIPAGAFTAQDVIAEAHALADETRERNRDRDNVPENVLSAYQNLVTVASAGSDNAVIVEAAEALIAVVNEADVLPNMRTLEDVFGQLQITLENIHYIEGEAATVAIRERKQRRRAAAAAESETGSDDQSDSDSDTRPPSGMPPDVPNREDAARERRDMAERHRSEGGDEAPAPDQPRERLTNSSGQIVIPQRFMRDFQRIVDACNSAEDVGDKKKLFAMAKALLQSMARDGVDLCGVSDDQIAGLADEISEGRNVMGTPDPTPAPVENDVAAQMDDANLDADNSEPESGTVVPIDVEDDITQPPVAPERMRTMDRADQAFNSDAGAGWGQMERPESLRSEDIPPPPPPLEDQEETGSAVGSVEDLLIFPPTYASEFEAMLQPFINGDDMGAQADAFRRRLVEDGIWADTVTRIDVLQAVHEAGRARGLEYQDPFAERDFEGPRPDELPEPELHVLGEEPDTQTDEFVIAAIRNAPSFNEAVRAQIRGDVHTEADAVVRARHHAAERTGMAVTDEEVQAQVDRVARDSKAAFDIIEPDDSEHPSNEDEDRDEGTGAETGTDDQPAGAEQRNSGEFDEAMAAMEDPPPGPVQRNSGEFDAAMAAMENPPPGSAQRNSGEFDAAMAAMEDTASVDSFDAALEQQLEQNGARDGQAALAFLQMGYGVQDG